MLRTARLWLFVCLVSGIALVLGCSDDDDPTVPDEDTVASVTVSPDSATLTANGQTVQFEAVARDEHEEIVSATFVWESTNEDAVFVNSAGRAVAVAAGSSWVSATVDEVSDSSLVTVIIDEVPEGAIAWAAAVDGSWHEPDNWSSGTVPSASDTVVIGLEGTYTVTLAEDVSVAHLNLGNETGTQTLATSANTLTLPAATLSGGAVLQVDHAVSVDGDVAWKGGRVTGDGTLTVESGAEFTLGGGADTLRLTSTLRNEGVVALESGIQFYINGGSLESEAGALVDFRSDATIFPHQGGVFTSAGTIRKSGGSGTAYTGGVAGTFVTTGAVDVQSGTLSTSGEWHGEVDVAAEARLYIGGTTTFGGDLSFSGPGAVEIDASVTAGDEEGETLVFRYLILTTRGTLSGLADLTVSDSLVWQGGSVAGSGELEIPEDAVLRFVEGSYTKNLSGRALRVWGQVQSGRSLDLALDEDAVITVQETGRWDQGHGGTIRQRLDSESSMEVKGELTKQDVTASTVEIPFTCSGTLKLYDGALTVTGDFLLTEDGVIKGGGLEPASGSNTRLILAHAPSAVLAGTIEPDYEGASAWLDILGLVTLTETTVVRVDMEGTDPIRYERLSISAGVQMAGSLEVSRSFTPELEDQFKVVSVIDGSGAFTVEGADGFDVTQDASGVTLVWTGE